MKFGALAGMVVAASQLAAQGLVTGVIKNDQGRKLPGVEIFISGADKTFRSDSNGAFKFALRAGTYILGIRALGYFTVSDSVDIEDNVETIHDFTLSSFGITLDTVTTTAARKEYLSPALRDFEERRKMHMGRFIAEDEFRKADGRLLSEVLRKLPGMRVVPGTGTQYWAAGSRTAGAATGSGGAILGAKAGGNCYVTVYVDGVLTYDGGVQPRGTTARPPDINTLNTSVMAGAEYYASNSTAPAQYRDRSGCGLLMLWTRER